MRLLWPESTVLASWEAQGCRITQSWGKELTLESLCPSLLPLFSSPTFLFLPSKDPSDHQSCPLSCWPPQSLVPALHHLPTHHPPLPGLLSPRQVPADGAFRTGASMLPHPFPGVPHTGSLQVLVALPLAPSHWFMLCEFVP